MAVHGAAACAVLVWWDLSTVSAWCWTAVSWWFRQWHAAAVNFLNIRVQENLRAVSQISFAMPTQLDGRIVPCCVFGDYGI